MLSFLIISILLVMIAVAAVAFPLLKRRNDDTAPIAGTITAILIPVSVLLIYAVISSYPWQLDVPAAAMAPPATENQSMASAISRLEQRLNAEPDDAEGWLLLGRSYVTEQRYTEAGSAYRKVLDLTDGTSVEAMLGLSEAVILSGQTAGLTEAAALIERVLAEDPDNRKALWYGGQVALSQENIAIARQRWSRLLTLSPPEALQNILEIQLQALNAPEVPAGDVPVSVTAVATGITITVDIEESLRGQVKEGARLFIIARDADAPGPPLAAVPRLARDLPVTVTITDADRMIPDRSLADIARIKVIARVANGGDALAAPGDIFGEALWQGSQSQDEPLTIMLNQIVPQ